MSTNINAWLLGFISFHFLSNKLGYRVYLLPVNGGVDQILFQGKVG